MTTSTTNDGRYDRQLRLWGALGQEYFVNTPVVALGTTVEVQETLKDLVLAGIGAITLIDPLTLTITDSDHSCLIRAAPESIESESRFRAEAVRDGLNELNPSVPINVIRDIDPVDFFNYVVNQEKAATKTGHYSSDVSLKSETSATSSNCDEEALEEQSLNGSKSITEDEIPYVNDDLNSRYKTALHRRIPGFHDERLRPVIVVSSEYANEIEFIMKHLPPEVLRALPVTVILRAYFFYGSVRVLAAGHYILDDQDRNEESILLRLRDLRLQFPNIRTELGRIFHEGFSLSEESEIGKHVPWLAVLNRVLDIFWDANERLPTAEDKEDLIDILNTTVQCQVALDAANIQEAKRKMFLLWKTSCYAWPPAHITLFIEERETSTDNHLFSRFELALASLNHFHDEYKRLPLAGSVPDMTSSSNFYTRLADAYRGQANEDLSELMRYSDEILEEHGKPFDELHLLRSNYYQFLTFFVKRCHALRYDDTAPTQGDQEEKGKEILDHLRQMCDNFKGGITNNQSQLSGVIVGALGAQEITKVTTHQWRPRTKDHLVWNGYNNMVYYVTDKERKALPQVTE